MVMVWRRMPRGMTFEQLMSQAAASGTPSFAPKSLPSMDLPSMGESSDEGEDDVRPLSRGDIEKEIAAGRIARTTDMEMLD